MANLSYDIIKSMIKKKLKKIKTEGLHQLPYISPWIHIDSSRELQHQLAKNKLMQEIAIPHHPIHLQSKKNSSAQSYNSNISPRKINSNRNRSFEASKQEIQQIKSVGKIKNCNSFICRRDKNRKDIIQKTIFARKRPPSSKMRVVSLGNESFGYNLVMKVPRKTIGQQSPQSRLRQSRSLVKSQPKNESWDTSKRIAYKRISLSLLNSLANQSQEVMNKKLGKTLENFMNLQKQI